MKTISAALSVGDSGVTVWALTSGGSLEGRDLHESLPQETGKELPKEGQAP